MAASPPRRAAPLRSVAARLTMLAPVTVGILITEGFFAARGRSGDMIALPAAGLALVLLWLGVAWALRSWVVLLMTFVPAIMVTLGTAMIGGLAPGAGAALLLVGLALIGAIVSFRLSSPARGWDPDWLGRPRAAGAYGTAGSASPVLPARRSGSVTEGTGAANRPAPPDAPEWLFDRLHPLDQPSPWFAAELPGVPAGTGPTGRLPEPTRPAPDWDTSRTVTLARDDLVALLCRRGGTTGPTLASLEEFFTGNGDPRSIAPGLRGQVPLATFRSALHRLRERREVSQVLIQVEPLEPGSYPAGEWPVAGSVHIIGTLSADEIDAAVVDLRAEPALGPLPADVLSSGAPAPARSAEYALWWA